MFKISFKKHLFLITTFLVMLVVFMFAGEAYAGTGDGNIQNKAKGIEVSSMGAALQSANGIYTLKTNLKDGFTMRASKKVFDVWAMANGRKTWAEAGLYRLISNGDEKKVLNLSSAWDDGSKVSFLLDMSGQETGDFRIRVWTGGASIDSAAVVKTYDFTYQKVPEGGYIGDITIDIEAFTISLGYIEEPVRFPVYNGENGAQVLDRFLKKCGYTYDGTGALDYGFYLGRIKGLSIDLSKAELEEKVSTKLNKEDYGWNKDDYTDGTLGEFDYTGFSGWMYCVNNVFPNVGFSDFYFDGGDVVRLQFTVALGHEIGGSGGTGGWNPDWYAVADKDDLTDLLADINTAMNSKAIKDDQKAARLIANAIKVNESIASTQADVDEAYDSLIAYLGKMNDSPDISLNAAQIQMRKGNTQKLEAEIGETTSLKPQHLMWSSEETYIATVDGEGNVTGHNAGTTIITARIGDSKAECQVTIEEVPLEGIKIVPFHDDMYQYKTDETTYRFNTGYYPTFIIEPVPADTTDDYTPAYKADTKRYMDFTVIQDHINRCAITGKHEGKTVLTATVGDFIDQIEIEFYENKTIDFTVDDPEPVLSINGYGAVKSKELSFTVTPSNSQDRSDVFLASSDTDVFVISGQPTVWRQPGHTVKIIAQGEGVAELYVTVGNITKTYPVTVYDLKESDEIVPKDYSLLSQTFSTLDRNENTGVIGGTRYRAGKVYTNTTDAKKFIMRLSDPNQILAFGGYRLDDGTWADSNSSPVVSYISHDFVCSGKGADTHAITALVPHLTGTSGTATLVNRMNGKERQTNKVVVEEEVIPAEKLTILSNGNAVEYIDEFKKSDTFDLTYEIQPRDATGEIVWYSSDLSVAEIDQAGHVTITGYGDAEIVACLAGVYKVCRIHSDQPMTGMTISNESLDLTTGITRQLMAWCVPNDTTDDHTITWSSSAPEVVSVTDNGKITTCNEGEATITASTGKYSVTCHVIVDDHKLRQLYFLKSPVYVEVGETVSLGAPSTVPASVHAEVSDYTWSSSDESKATVDQEGNVTLLKASEVDRAGTVITRDDYYKNCVKIYAEKDGIKGTCVIHTGALMTGIGLSSSEITIFKGDEVDLDAIFFPEDTTEDRSGITWQSSNPIIVSQREGPYGYPAYRRLIVGLKPGEATVTVNCGEYKANCLVKVVLPPAQQAAYDLQQKISAWAELDPEKDRADYVREGLEIQAIWETFTDPQKEMVGAYESVFAEHLGEILAMAGDDDKAAAAEALIGKIGKVTLDRSCRSRIETARKAFDALTDTQKALVSADALKVLEDAEKRYAKLKQEDDKKKEIAKKKAAARSRRVKGLKVKARSRKFTLTWKKTKGASGYQVQYRRKGVKKFKNLKKYVTRRRVKSRKLKKGRKYQFRVRTYVKIEGKPVYGKWTKVRTKKCR